MKIYLLSLGAGLLVGVVYSLLQVRSPAPPLVALIGLLGITAFAAACDKEKAVSHVFGQLPGRQAQGKDQS